MIKMYSFDITFKLVKDWDNKYVNNDNIYVEIIIYL